MAPGELKITVLGCGSSPGVPRIGNDWGACDSGNPKNRRLRTALLVERFSAAGGVTRVLVDTGPDLREQMLSADVDWLDGVFYTHPHADHIHGIDDLRAFAIVKRRRVDLYMDDQTAQRMHEAFRYCFETPAGSAYPPIVNDHRIVAGEPVTIEGEGGPIPVLPYRQIHGSIDSLGFRFGGLAYSPDISVLPDETVPQLADLDIWMVDALRYTPHPSHYSVSEALEAIERVKPRRAILTHLHIDLDYATLSAELPAHVEPAYDGMVLKTQT